MEQQLACQDLGIPLLVAGPLAGGLLTHRHIGKKTPGDLTRAEQRHWNTSFQTWLERNEYTHTENKNDMWEIYQSNVVSVLEQIALKHGVSISTVALRWSLQLPRVAGVVVSCRLIPPDDGLRRKDRTQELRQVFRFELDEEDMKQLWDLTGYAKGERTSLASLEEDMTLDAMTENESGLFVPRGGSGVQIPSRELWL